jgi:hypothetical protein
MAAALLALAIGAARAQSLPTFDRKAQEAVRAAVERDKQAHVATVNPDGSVTIPDKRGENGEWPYTDCAHDPLTCEYHPLDACSAEGVYVDCVFQNSIRPNAIHTNFSCPRDGNNQRDVDCAWQSNAYSEWSLRLSRCYEVLPWPGGTARFGDALMSPEQRAFCHFIWKD